MILLRKIYIPISANKLKNIGGISLVYATIPVDAYVVEHYMPKLYTWKDRILLHNKGVLVGILYFYENEILEKAISVKKPEYFVMNFEIGRFDEIINTLRYEKPIYVYFDYNQADNKILWGCIRTDPNHPEAIGEQEGV